jgi:probable phosphoglycerate mutase
MQKIYLIRHGESEANIGCSDEPDCRLTERGLQQARELAERMAEMDWAGFTGLVSPYQRARRTAEVIAERTGLRFAIDPMIREWGKDCTIEGELYRLESREELAARMRAVHERLRDGRYVLVSHAAPIAALLRVASGGPVNLEGEFWAGIENCCLRLT